jgi:microcystin-dependent protein
MNYSTKILLVVKMIVLSNVLATTQVWADEPFIGEIRQFPYSFCPRGWTETNGALLSISQNTALFSILGTTYGGDGRTTFGVPDLNARVAKGDGNGPGLNDVRLGEKNGVESFNYTGGVPAHTHNATTASTVHASSADGNTPAPANGLLADDGRDRVYNQEIPDVSLNALSVISDTTLADSPAPSSSSVDRRQPFLGMRFCIATAGLFPSRS